MPKENIPKSEYMGMVDFLQKNKLNMFIQNSSIFHAKYVSRKLIESANNELNIFSGTLDETFFCSDAILNTLKEKFEKNPSFKINIVVESEIESNILEFKKKLGDCLFDDGRINVFPRKAHEKITHFMVNDTNGIRIEEEHQLGDVQNIRAKINFNSPRYATKFWNIFNELKGIN